MANPFNIGVCVVMQLLLPDDRLNDMDEASDDEAPARPELAAEELFAVAQFLLDEIQAIEGVEDAVATMPWFAVLALAVLDASEPPRPTASATASPAGARASSRPDGVARRARRLPRRPAAPPKPSAGEKARRGACFTTHVDGESVFGLFLRRTLLDASLRHFDSVVGTYDRLVVYQSAYARTPPPRRPPPPAAAAAAPRAARAPRALDALHRYFDYARARGGPRSPNDAKSARGVAQYAALNLAAVHVRFGHHGLAAIAIDEAVRVAQQRHDHACVTFALSWLKHVDEQEREADADRHGPPLPGEDDGGGANADAPRRGPGQGAGARRPRGGVDARVHGRATKALEVPGERDGPAAHHLAMTPQQRLARDAEQRRRGLLGEAEGAGLGKDAAITERRTVATDAPRTVVAQAAAKRHAVAGGVWTHFGFRRMSNLARGARAPRAAADGDAAASCPTRSARARDLAFAALATSARERGARRRVAYAVALRRLERLGPTRRTACPRTSPSARSTCSSSSGRCTAARTSAEALASLLGVSPVQADLGPEAHVEAVRASARLLARRERWERAVKTMNELERYCGRKGLWAQQAECLMLGAHWRLDACPQSPVPALSPALRCLALCEKFALDHLHAEAAFALGRVNVYLGSVAKARSLIQGALPKLLGHSHVQLQGDAWYALAETELREKAYATKSPEIHKDVVAEGLKDFSRPLTYYGRALEAFTYVQNWKRMQDAHYYLSMIHHQLVDATDDACENKAARLPRGPRLKLNDDLNRSQQDLMFFRPIWILPAEWGEYEHDDQTRRDAEPRPVRPALDIMLRRIKKFTVYSSAIVVGQASRALDNAPFAGQDESEDAKNLLRRLSDGVSVCDDKEEPYHELRTNQFWKFFDYCIDLDETELRVPPASLQNNKIDGTLPVEIGQLTKLQYLRVPPASPTPGAPRDRPSASQEPLLQLHHRYLTNTKITGTLPVEFGQLTKLTYLRVPPPRRPARATVSAPQASGSSPSATAPLTRSLALDHLHAEAAFALGRVNVYLGSVAKARSLIQGALPKLLGHSHVQLQGDAWYALAETELREKAYATKSPEIHKDVVAEGLKDFSRPLTYYGRALEAFTYVQNWKRMQDAHYYLSMIHHQLVDATDDACENKAKRDYHADRALKLNDDLNRSQQDLMFFRPIWILPAEWGEYEHDDQTRRDAEPRV
ncbi:hypothetical protein JL722_14508 [Aureococcus anophagefferens]|nr:hypothetical protein JL722_14508 [Aureococcus anophagefferens]